MTEHDIYLFKEGTHARLYEKFGCQLAERDGVAGAHFCVWAPNAQRVSAIGDWNGWNEDAHPLRARWYGTEGVGLRHAVTIAFMTLTLTNVFHSFSARSRTRSAFTASLFTNGWLWAAVLVCLLLQTAAVYVPFLQAVLHTVPLTATDWGVIAACSLTPIAVVELVKVVQRSTTRKRTRLNQGGIVS